MKPRSLLFRSICALTFALSATQGWAGPLDLVELTGYVGFSSTTGTGGFEADNPAGNNVEIGPFRLIYDPLIPDSNHSEDVGLFRGAIRVFEMTIYQESRPALRFSLVGRGDIYRGASDPLFPENAGWHMTLREENNVFAPSAFAFYMIRSHSYNPNAMPTIDFWTTATALTGGGAGAYETDWLYSGPMTARTVPRPVPAPSTLWLMLIGGAAAFSRAYLRREENQARLGPAAAALPPPAPYP